MDIKKETAMPQTVVEKHENTPHDPVHSHTDTQHLCRHIVFFGSYSLFVFHSAHRMHISLGSKIKKSLCS